MPIVAPALRALGRGQPYGENSYAGVPSAVSVFNTKVNSYLAISRPKTFWKLSRGLFKYPTGWFEYRGILFCFTGFKAAADNDHFTGQILAQVVVNQGIGTVPSFSRYFCSQAGTMTVFEYPLGDEFKHIPVSRFRWIRTIQAMVSLFIVSAKVNSLS